ncbi:MAG: MerR family transcriptional regulator [Planctomycetales bacterium]|nr:MerR family transcriptional regulator [Planctomycetales bacterium]
MSQDPRASEPSHRDVEPLRGRRVAFCGKLGSMTQREARELVRELGGSCVDRNDSTLELLVVGADELPWNDLDELDALCRSARPNGAGGEASLLSDEMRNLVRSRQVDVVSETVFWEQLGVVESQADVRRLYTPAMLAELVGVTVGTIRSWHRRQLIVPVRMVHRLPYFDFQEVTTARRLAQLIATGVSASQIQSQLAALAQFVPEVERPLAQLAVIVEGKRILLREGEGLIEPNGQLRFDFDSLESPAITSLPMNWRDELDEFCPDQLLEMAMQLEEEGRLREACELYRAALAAGGPDAEVCFQLAELLYRLGHTEAAAERYYMAIELNDDYVEARANLGCVLAELGELSLAAAAFQGALVHHDEYADVHFHLARVLDDLHEPEQAEHHWREFLRLSPDSPWADEARMRLDQHRQLTS